MTDAYHETKADLQRQITAQKNIYKFRTFLYSLNKDVRHRCFEICYDYLQNETHNVEITGTEYIRLTALLHHWNWETFEQSGSAWWSVLSSIHYKSVVLMTLIHLWIDDIQTFDPDAFETSTIGLT